ncbi:MAG TPA: family 16 glycosylhydrolase [Tepidisphaeraceae bacterium]
MSLTALSLVPNFFLFALCPTFARAVSTPQPDIAGDWQLSWDDEFNTGTSTDLAGWSYDLGNGSSQGITGWGNNEDEYYTNSSTNVNVANGDLNIVATPQTITSSGYTTHYTSARIKTPSLFDQTYGVIEFRAELPAGKGLWPAVWMMPENSSYGGWPTSGEIDMTEAQGSSPSFVQGSLHSGTSSNTEDNQTGYYEPSGFNPTTGFHTYDLVWTNGSPGSFKWYVDGHLYETQTGGWVVPSGQASEAPFNQPFYLLINLAMGGNYGGSDSGSTGGTLAIDYVRTYSNMLGDTNSDGVVNTTDLATITKNLGKKISGGYTVGDFNDDGYVNQDDLALYQLGLSEQSKLLYTAPEPGMLAIGLAPLILWRRKRS